MGWKQINYLTIISSGFMLSENQCGMETRKVRAYPFRFSVEREPMWDGNDAFITPTTSSLILLSENQCGMETRLYGRSYQYQRPLSENQCGMETRLRGVGRCRVSRLSENQCGMETIYQNQNLVLNQQVEREPMWDGNLLSGING